MTSIDYRSVIDLTGAQQPNYTISANNNATQCNETLKHMDSMLQCLELQTTANTLQHNSALQAELHALYSQSAAPDSSSLCSDIHTVNGIQQHINLITSLNTFLTDITDSCTSITATKQSTRSLYQILTYSTHSTVQHIYIHPQYQKQFIELLNNVKHDISVQGSNVNIIQHISRLHGEIQQCSSVLGQVSELLESNVVDVDTVNKLKATLQKYCALLQQKVDTS